MRVTAICHSLFDMVLSGYADDLIIDYSRQLMHNYLDWDNRHCIKIVMHFFIKVKKKFSFSGDEPDTSSTPLSSNRKTI